MSAPEQTDDRDALTRLEEELLQIKARVNGVPTTRPRCPARLARAVSHGKPLPLGGSEPA